MRTSYRGCLHQEERVAPLQGGQRFVRRGKFCPALCTNVPAVSAASALCGPGPWQHWRGEASLPVCCLGASVHAALERADAGHEHEEDVGDDAHGEDNVDVLPLVSRKGIEVELVHHPVALRHVGVPPRSRVVLEEVRFVKLVEHLRGNGVVQRVEVHQDALRPVDLGREDDDAVGGQHGHEHDVEEEGGGGGQVGEQQPDAHGGHLARAHPDEEVEPVEHLVGGAVAVARHVVDDDGVADGLEAAPEEALQDDQPGHELHAVVVPR
mmetsp:Transcript_30951/g.67622  ORF Transcript_30951/g.67622 Transcript_30951/m.67622 type:complete len:267 (-) Transcript_30951:634-1434(-)